MPWRPLRALQGALSGLEQIAAQKTASAAPHAPPVPDHITPPEADIREAAAPKRSAGGPPGRDRVVRDLSERAAAREHRSVAAINQMGHEVIRVAQSLEGRVGAVERRSDERAAAIGGEMSRLADAMDDRLARADDARAGAFQELGGTIASVADQLAGAISASELRSATIVAKGLDDVGERLKRAIETMNTHYELAAIELAKQSPLKDEPEVEPEATACAAQVIVVASAAPELGSGSGSTKSQVVG